MVAQKFWIKWFQFLTINSASQASIHKARVRSRDILKAGKKILIFPEGSRSKTGDMHKFKRLAFQLSVDYKVPVIAVLQSNDTKIMTKDFTWSFFPKREAFLRIAVLPPLFPKEGETASQFTTRVESKMAEELQKLDSEHEESGIPH